MRFGASSTAWRLRIRTGARSFRERRLSANSCSAPKHATLPFRFKGRIKFLAGLASPAAALRHGVLFSGVDKNKGFAFVFASFIGPLDSRAVLLVTLFTKSDSAARFRVDG
jgi:hypothetical protein